MFAGFIIESGTHYDEQANSSSDGGSLFKVISTFCCRSCCTVHDSNHTSFGRILIGLPEHPEIETMTSLPLTESIFDEGGGINLVDIWNRQTGIALCHLATKDLFVSFPTQVENGGPVRISMVEEPDPVLGDQTEINPGETYRVRAPIGIIAHPGDYFEPLRTYRDLLIDRGIAIQTGSPEWTYQSYWKTWGWKRDFTLEMVYNRIPQLLELGIRQLQIDDGWQDYVGDWKPNREKYPNGEADLIASVRKIKELGIERVYLWWNPLGVEVDSKMAQNKEWLVLDQEGNPASRQRHSLCPA